MKYAISAVMFVAVSMPCCVGHTQIVEPGGGSPPPQMECILNNGVVACATEKTNLTENCPEVQESTCGFGALCQKYTDKSPTCKGTIEGDNSNAVDEFVAQLNSGSATAVPVFAYKEEDEDHEFPLLATDTIACVLTQGCKCVPIPMTSDFECQPDGPATICHILRLRQSVGPCVVEQTMEE